MTYKKGKCLQITNEKSNHNGQYHATDDHVINGVLTWYKLRQVRASSCIPFLLKMTISEVDKQPASLPILDYSLLQSHAENQSEFFSQLRSALLSSGFFYITNHGIAQDDIDQLFGHLKRFFTLPLEKKEEITMEKSPYFRGYTRLGEEITDFVSIIYNC